MTDPTTEAAERFALDTGPHTREETLPYGTIGPRRLVTYRPHEMTVLHNDGLYRHLRFQSPDTGGYRFDLVTFPHNLVFRGEGDTYLFNAGEDMFEFFRKSSWHGSANHTYWAQKLPGGDRSVMHYDREQTEKHIKEHVAESIRAGGTPRGLAKAVVEMLADDDFDTADGACLALDRFEHGAGYEASCSCGAKTRVDDYMAAYYWRQSHARQVADDGPRHVLTDRRVEGFQFYDVWEWPVRDYDLWFLWACHAILWGIGRYDEAQADVPAVEAVAVSV